MNIFKSIATIAGAVVLSASSALATPTTRSSTSYDVIVALQEAGVEVVVNTHECTGHHHGSYEYASNLSIAKITLCPGDEVDPVDHRTVKHEAMHVIQSCVNYQLGRPHGTPVLTIDNLVTAVNKYVPAKDVEFIKAHYPSNKWGSEFEAFLAEHAYTNDQIINGLRKACYN